ncbi:unnamed protein product [Rotaria sp. Silwood1]|nr:unnamed protein product [Rotaria sp. Silwood1]CAF1297079.1 unnamed protein product [Rotaria sp. Silwood1]CAF3546755.1 unnamed protein product [Rotaria sp. Silwood1]CAF4778417.1 unnamed protein product [Rotaria sp. Silwood1]
MSDTTCHYNKTHGIFNRREIRMLAQALGLPEERIDKRLNKLEIGETVQTSKLLDLIEKGVFATDFNYMYNSQSGRYNSVVLAKALQLVDSHLFSFNDISKARLAFNMYEMNVSNNDRRNFELILRTIKFCDCRISNLKLERRLHHYRLNNARILHLCEYFDLLLICNRDNNNAKLFSTKIVDLVDPKPIDQQMMDELNTKYLRDEHNWFLQENFSKQKIIENSVWPAKIAHQHQANIASIRKAQLQRQLSASISSLKQSRAGSACSSRSHLLSSSLRQSRPVSHCSSTSLTPMITRSNTCSAQSNRTLISENDTEPDETKPDEIKLDDAKPKEKELNETLNRWQQLQSESAFLTIKYALHREDYMNELLPDGYSKPIIVSKPIERQLKKSKSLVHWPRQTTTHKTLA